MIEEPAVIEGSAPEEMTTVENEEQPAIILEDNPSPQEGIGGEDSDGSSDGNSDDNISI